MTPISICMIGKNEERCLESTLTAASAFIRKMPAGSEIVFCDTGSTDDTRKIAESFTSRVFAFAWCDDFSAARNYCLKQAKNNMTFSLDCDEVIRDYDISGINRDIKRYGRYLGEVSLFNHSEEVNDYRENEEYRLRRVFDRRLYQYSGIIHEQVTSIRSEELFFYTLPLSIEHFGYEEGLEERQKKAARNAALLRKVIENEPDQPYHYMQLGQTYRAIEDYSEAARWYEKACLLPLSPELPYVETLLLNYGSSLLHLNRIEEALTLLSRFYPDYFLSSDLFCLAGEIYQHAGEPIKAMLEYINAVLCPIQHQKGTNSFIPYFQIGVIYEALGKRDLAMENYRKCGDYPPALNCLKELESQ